MTGINLTRRELAHRLTNGVEVSLFWDAVGDTLTLEVRDEAANEYFQLDVSRDRALDAFHHPYAYRASAERRELSEPLAA
jgi:hypothetical protein